MQAWTPEPPPPGLLGADSLGLMLPVVIDDDLPPPPGKVGVVPTVLGTLVVSPPGVVTVVVVPPGVVTVVPPLPRKVDAVGGDRGATGRTCGAGVPMADGGSVPGVVAGLAGGAVSDPLDLLPNADGAVVVAPEPTELPPRPPLWASALCGKAAMRRLDAAAAKEVAHGFSIGHLRFPAVP